MGQKKRGKMEAIMLILSEFYYNHHPSGVRMLAKFIRGGFPVIHFWNDYVMIVQLILWYYFFNIGTSSQIRRLLHADSAERRY